MQIYADEPYAASLAAAKRPYIPMGFVKPSQKKVRLQIQRGDRSVFTIEDQTLCYVHSSRPASCTLFYTHCMIFMIGKRLDVLVDVLKHYEPRFIERFDPAVHHELSGDEQWIERLFWQTVLWNGKHVVPRRSYADSYRPTPLILIE